MLFPLLLRETGTILMSHEKKGENHRPVASH
jgi:hypothetical protein